MNKYDLSVLIPSRNEMFLSRTVEELLKNKRGNTEVIVGLDGSWSDPVLEDHKDLTVYYSPVSIGQRAITNQCARLSNAKYVMKIDAHSAVDEGFDIKMMDEMQDDYTMIPILYNLHGFDWVCFKCKDRRYQSPTPTSCPKCDNTTHFTRDIIWKPRRSRKSQFYRFDTDLHFQYHGARKAYPEAQGTLVETMSAQGSCFMLTRDKYWKLNICDEEHGSWGQQGTEVACKTWLSGGRLVTNTKTWYSHMFRTQGKDFGFPYPQSGTQVENARKYSKDMWFNNKFEKQIYPLSWLIEKFAPLNNGEKNGVPDWHDEKGKDVLDMVKKKGEEFYKRKPYFRKVEVVCYVCGKNYLIKPSRENKTRCCSRECLNQYKSEAYKGREMSAEWKEKIGVANTGEKHGLWRGNEVGYKALHDWVRRHKGIPIKCEHCGGIDTLNWANKSHEYKREIEDWLSLCKKCHWQYDHRPSRSIVYYTDNELNLKISHAVKKQLKKIGLPIVSTSLKPIDFGKNIHMKGMKRGYEAYFKQILTALENSDSEVIYFCEHDWLYHPSHFEFTPLRRDTFYYNWNWWRVRSSDGHAVHYDTQLVPGIVAYRELFLEYYRKLVSHLDEVGFTSENAHKVGFEPGTHKRIEFVKQYKTERFESKYPIIDIRHTNNLTSSKWSPDAFRNPKNAQNWQETKEIPGWGLVENNFDGLLRQI